MSVRRRVGVDSVAGPGVVMLLSTLAAVQALRLWDWRPGTPFGLAGDATYVSMEIRDIVENGWYWRNPDLGFPFHQAGYLFPDPSLLNTLAVKTLALVTTDPFTIGALWLVLSFPLAGLAMYALARSQSASRPVAVVIGTLFAAAPGHQTQFGHLWLAMTWVLPAGLWLVLTAAEGRSLFAAERRRTTLALAALVGLGHIYYVAFTLLLLAAVLLVRVWSRRRLFVVADGAAVAAVIGLLALVPLLVTKWASRGQVVTGTLPASRASAQSETYAGKLMDLVLPWYDHRLEPLSFLTWAYNLSPIRTVERPALGLVALVGATGLLLVALSSLFGQRTPSAPSARLSAVGLVAFLLYTVGGLGSVLAFFGTPQLRTWSRMAIVIMAVALLLVGRGLDRVLRGSRRLGLALCVLTLVVGVLDQTSPRAAPDHAGLRAQRTELTAYAEQVAGATSRGCGVFQLPVVVFPETMPPGRMAGYDQQRTYAAAGGGLLRWSGGAMRGTPAGDWQRAVHGTDPAALASDLAAVGYCAVEVDAAGYANAPADLPDFEPVLGAPVATALDGRLTTFRLPPAPTDAAARKDAVLHPVIVDLAAYEVRADQAGHTRQWLGPRASLKVANLGAAVVPGLTITAVMASVRGERTLTVRVPGRPAAVSALTEQPTSFSLTMDAPPGVTTIEVEVSGDPDVDSDPGVARSAIAGDLSATTTAGSARLTTGHDGFLP